MTTDSLAGIDVSHYNGTIDWTAVSGQGIAFAFAKATEGLNTQDAQFQPNFAGMKQHGILRGAYHFFHPDLDTRGQAANFLARVKALAPGDLPPVLDVEIDGGRNAADICAGIQAWLDQVEQTLGRTPMLYTTASFWNASVGASKAFGKYPLWVAHYTSKPAPALPAAWNNYAIWQYDESGSIAGISGPVDRDRFNGTADDLRRLAGL